MGKFKAYKNSNSSAGFSSQSEINKQRMRGIDLLKPSLSTEITSEPTKAVEPVAVEHSEL